MRFIFFISFVILLSCNNHKQEKQEKPRSELAILSQAISTLPNKPEHFVKRAEYFLEKDNLESALMDYKECVRLSPNNGNYHYKLPIYYMQTISIKASMGWINNQKVDSFLFLHLKNR